MRLQHFRDGDVQLLLKDVQSMLEQYPPLTVEQAIAGLRRSMRCPATPASARKWRLRGGGWMRQEFGDILEAHGYELQRDGRATRIAKVA